MELGINNFSYAKSNLIFSFNSSSDSFTQAHFPSITTATLMSEVFYGALCRQRNHLANLTLLI